MPSRAGTCKLTLMLRCPMVLMHLPTAHALQDVFNFKVNWYGVALISRCKVCGLCCTMAYLFATRGLTIACNDRWWTAYLLIVPSMRVSCLRHTVRPLLEELNRQQYREEVDSATILQTSTRSAASELARAGRQAAESSIGSRQQYREEVDCKCSR